MEKLKVEQVLACATIRQNRKWLPENMTSDKDLKRGEYDYRVSNVGISFFKWNDNKCINFHGTEKTEVKRTQKDGSRKCVPCPIVVKRLQSIYGWRRFS